MNPHNPRRKSVFAALLGLALGMILAGGGWPGLKASAQEAREARSTPASESEPAIRPDVAAGLEKSRQEQEASKTDVAAGLKLEQRERAATKADVAAGLDLERQAEAARKAEVISGLAIERAGRAAPPTPAKPRPVQPAPSAEAARAPAGEHEESRRAERAPAKTRSRETECIERSGYTCDYLVIRAANGNAYAMFWLGVLTYEGSAFEKDPEAGRKWIIQANAGGFAPASRWLSDNPKPAK